MRRLTKLLLVVLSVALVVCGLTFAGVSASAASDRSGETTGFDYTDANGEVKNTADLQKAFNNAAAGSTVYLNGDTTLDMTNGKPLVFSATKYNTAGTGDEDGSTPNKGNLTFDLDGHTLTMPQTHQNNYFRIECNKQVIVQNGTIKAGSNAVNNTTDNLATAAPIFVINYGNAKLDIKNVNTYGAAIVGNKESWAPNATVNIIGGNHYCISEPFNTLYDAAVISSDNTLTATLEDATFYIDGANSFLSVSHSAMTSTQTTKTSRVNISNCNVIGESATTSLVKQLDADCTISIERSRIYGSITPVLSDGSDASSLTGITFGHEVYYSSAATLNVTNESGANVSDVSYALTTPALPDGSVEKNGFSGVYTMKDGIELTLDKLVSFPVSFQYIDANGVEGITIPYGTDISEVVADAPAGGTIKFLSNVESVGVPTDTTSKTYIAVIDKELTFDLNGFRWTVTQVSGDDGYQQRIGLHTSEPVVVKNGTLTARYEDTTTTAYTLFHGEGKVVDITFENVNTYLGTLVYLYSGNGSKITIKGGVHNVVYTGAGSAGGYICTNNNVTFVANDATFVVSNEMSGSVYLFNASHHKTGSALRNQTFTYNNCDILALDYTGTASSYTDAVSDSPYVKAGDLAMYASKDTDVAFNGCRIWGTLNTKPYDQNGYTGDSAMDAGSIVFGHGTQFVSANLPEGGIVAPKKGEFTDKSETKVYEIDKLINKDVYEHDWSTSAVQVTLTFDKITDATKAFAVYKDGELVEYLKDVYDENNYLTTPMTFYQAVETVTELAAGNTASSYTLRLLGDYTTVSTENGAIFDCGITVDLNGHTMNIIKGYFGTATAGQEKFDIATTGTVTFKNGSIKVTDIISKNTAYAIFYPSVNDVNIVLNNVNTYSGGIVYSYSSRVNMTVNGGEHVAYRSTAGTPTPALFAVRSYANITVNDAGFYLMYSMPLLASSSQNKKLAAEDRSSTYTFNGCNVYTHTANNNTSLISYLNGKTTVYFNGCDLYGRILPSVVAEDEDNGIRDYSVIMGHYNGAPTRWSCNETLKVTDYLLNTEPGYAAKAETATETLEANVWYMNYNPVNSSWNLDAETLTAAYDYTLAEGHVVEWYLYNSAEPFLTTTVLAGETVTPPRNLTLTDVDNGWYQLKYTAGSWSSTPISSENMAASGNKFSNTEAVHNLKITENTKLYPVCAFKPYLTSARYNVTLNANFCVSLHVPVAAPEGVTLIKIGKDDPGTKSVVDKVSYYTTIINWPTASYVADPKTSTVVFTVADILDTNGSPIQLTQTISKISVLNYAKSVLENESLSDAHGMMAAMLGYIKATIEITDKTPDDNTSYNAVLELYNTHKDKLPTYDDAKYDTALTTTTASMTGLDGIIKSVEYIFASEKPTFLFKFYNEKVTAVSLSTPEAWIRGAYKDEGVGYNWGSSSVYINTGAYLVYYGTKTVTEDGVETTKPAYVVKNGSTLLEYNENTNATASVASGVVLTASEYVYAVRGDGVPIYNCDKIMQLTVTDADGAIHQGTYDIDTYYTELKAKDTDDDDTFEKFRAYAFALRNYSWAASAYRFGPAKDSSGNWVTDVYWS